jgi:hypothetical protein
MGLTSIGRKVRKAAQKIFCVAGSEARGAAQGEIGLDSNHHTFTSGHG